MSKKTRTPKAAKNRADRLFKQLVRQRGECERCGATADQAQLQTSHIVTRARSNTRVDPDNAFLFCATCHRWWHQFPISAARFAITHRGEATLNRLEEAALQPAEVDWNEQVAVLEAMLEKEGDAT
jgi:5-methylcytosine-specific restriction endonuclease McrA